MRFRRSQILAIPAQEAYAHVLRPELLAFLAAPLLAFRPQSGVWPTRWTHGGSLPATLLLGGWLPLGTHGINIEVPDPQPNAQGVYAVRDNGRGGLAKTWDHWIYLEPLTETTCRYTDELTLQAGILTPVVWLFAAVFYTHRQRRWQQLVRAAFAQLPAAGAQASRV